MSENDALPPELVADYLAQLAERRREIEGYLAATPVAEEPLRRVAHQLSGSGGSFGFPAVSEAASAVEHASAQDLPATARRLIDLLATLSAGGGGILIVDDDPVMVRLLTAALNGASRPIRTAHSAAEARELLARERFDLVVLDLFLPD